MALVFALLPPAAAHGAEPPAPAPAANPGATSGPQRAPATVTLITGDKVTVTPGRPGTAPEVSVERAPGATGSVRVSSENGNTYVYPDEAVPYIAAGRLDRELFGVTQLLAQGYDDRSTRDLPLILTRTKGSAALGSDAPKDEAAGEPASALPGTESTLSLPSIRGEAVRTRRSKAAAFWSALTGPARRKGTPSEGRANGAPATPGTAPFAAGVDKVWLDGRAEASLTESTAQIGAPAAWASGGTGAGVRVAVLDSGIDATHPDVEKRIVKSRSFVPGESVTDRGGHGTHTASTLAGTGAASDGQERGVAPEADLLVGKVLSDKGYGLDSWIIAGMEWAARTERAKVISMSLGDAARHAQNDPLSIALDELSAETGALFVVAAGNEGPGPYSVTSPGTADAALTVGAVNRSDELAEFSGAGPRHFDDGLKPDITAPGVGVLAARSQYLKDGGDGYYMTLDGTSMATPQVAGAAVLLAQKHPGWSAQDIKDALMSTSMRTPRHSVYQAGTGRVVVPAAYYAEAFATGSVDAGLIPWSPGAQREPVRREITYTNTADSPLTLDLSVDAEGAGSQAFALGADQVTVPAHGTARTEVVVDPSGLAPGRYAAQVVASSTAGGRTTLHTAVGISVEPEKHNLTIRLRDRAGLPMSGSVRIAGDNGVTTDVWIPEDGRLTSRWAPGTYTLQSYPEVEGLHGPGSLGTAILVEPEVDLSKDREVVLDASRARQVKVDTPQPTLALRSRIDVWRSFTASEPEPGAGAVFDALFPSPAHDSVWALPTGSKVRKGSFAFGTRFRAEQTPLTISRGGQRLHDPLPQPGAADLPDGRSRLTALFADDGSTGAYSGLSARGKAVVVRGGSVTATDQAAAAAEAGAALLLVVNQGAGRMYEWFGRPGSTESGSVPVASVTSEEGEELIEGITAARGERVALTIESHPTPDYLYDLADYHIGAVPEDPSADTAPGSLARIDQYFALAPGKHGLEHRDDYPPYHWQGRSAYQPGKAVRLPFEGQPVSPGPRTDWVSAGPGVTWQEFTLLEDLPLRADTRTYEGGSRQEDRWFSPVVRPRMLDDGVLVRNPDGSFTAGVEGYGDAGAAHGGATGTQLTSFHQGDRQLSMSPYAWVGTGGLAPERLPYRMVVDTTGLDALSPYSTTTRTEWRFTSASVATPQRIPLVQLDYETELDLEGRAERRTGFTIRPHVLGGSSPQDAVSSLTLEVSYDDGDTWRKHDLKERKGAWRAALTAPPGADHVSVRVTAGQHNGGGVTQTVVRAFGLAP
ncbi:S8 family serine peptidase [Streptomyces sp. UH6]|uniref:S8 family peptidase n=1 Tax=Streptomyces sp. UH6 TaxID=2748379 RepID=UPI0015D4FD8D|nr:S8 family serine peptidase [Streptomyces sp. UH6]NYV73878.1 S8 family serine peptidase [Streptomyces sp. UH6]